ncbi:hypothetical protein ACFL59_09965 [Planctomycetota bacterium]
MKKTLTWLGICLPWIVGTVLLGTFCVLAFSRGRNLTPGLHAFGWIHDMLIGACIYLPALIIATGIVVATRERRSKRWRLGWPTLIAWTSVVIPLSALSAIPAAFFAGQEAGYRALDYQAIYDASMELRTQVMSSGADFVYASWEETPAPLPPAIAQLSPLQVYATTRAAIIQLGGGGPASHEGIGVVLVEKESYSLPQEGVSPLHDSLPVYRYWLYDSMNFLDTAETAEQADTPDND